MKKILKIALGVIFLAALLGTFVFLWNKTRPKKEVYNIVKPITDTIERRAIATGKVEPRFEILIKPQISGIISEVFKEAGEMVNEGEIIAKVKVIPEMGQLNSAQSRVELADIALKQATINYNRVKELFAQGVIAREELENSETAYARAKEEMQNAKDNLEIVQFGIASRNAEMSNTSIRATIKGMILDVPIKEGNSVIQSNNFNDGTTIASIADMNDMIFRGKVDETEVGKLREHMPVKISIGALQETTLDATLEYVSPKGVEENGVIMFEIKAAIQMPDSVFVRAGYSANADIVIDRRANILTIPESAVQFAGDTTYVFVLTSPEGSKDQTFERKDIKIDLSDGLNVQVIEGLDGSENIRGTRVVE